MGLFCNLLIHINTANHLIAGHMAENVRFYHFLVKPQWSVPHRQKDTPMLPSESDSSAFQDRFSGNALIGGNPFGCYWVTVLLFLVPIGTLKRSLSQFCHDKLKLRRLLNILSFLELRECPNSISYKRSYLYSCSLRHRDHFQSTPPRRFPPNDTTRGPSFHHRPSQQEIS